VEIVTHDLVILGAGLAGLRAALEAAAVSRGTLDIALVSKVQLMRAHSVAAEGGTAAVLRPEEGDSLELHAWDTVKGSDFLADQEAVDLFVRAMPEEILRLEHWGCPGPAAPTGASPNDPSAATPSPAPSTPRTRPASSRCRPSTTPCSATPRSGATTSASSPPWLLKMVPIAAWWPWT